MNSIYKSHAVYFVFKCSGVMYFIRAMAHTAFPQKEHTLKGNAVPMRSMI